MGDTNKERIICEKSSNLFYDEFDKRRNQTIPTKDEKQKKVLFGDNKSNDFEKKQYIQSNEEFFTFLKDTTDYLKKDHGFKTKNEDINQKYTLLKEEQEKNEIISVEYKKLEEKYKYLKQKYNDLKDDKVKQQNRNDFETNSDLMQLNFNLKERNQTLENENKLLKKENFQYKRYIKQIKK